MLYARLTYTVCLFVQNCENIAKLIRNFEHINVHNISKLVHAINVLKCLFLFE